MINIIKCKCPYINNHCPVIDNDIVVGYPHQDYNDNVLETLKPILPSRFKTVLDTYEIIEHYNLNSVKISSSINNNRKWHLCCGEGLSGLCIRKEKVIHLFYFTNYFNINNRIVRILKKIKTILHELQHGFQHLHISKKYDSLKNSFDKETGEYSSDISWIENNAIVFSNKFILRNKQLICSTFDIEPNIITKQLIESLY